MWCLIVPFLVSSPLLQDPEPIVTDRPDFTESSLVVGPEVVQIESGLTYSRGDDGRSLQGPETLVRYGLSAGWEFRIGLPNYRWDDSASGGRLSGWDDLYVGAKVQILSNPDGLRAALIPAVLLPVGQEDLRSEEVAPEVKAVWSIGLPGDKALSGMVYVSSVTRDGRRVSPVQHTLSFGVPLGDRTGCFIEHVLDVERGVRPSQTLHAGLTFQPDPDRQFDVHFGFRLAGPVPDVFLAGGYSIRF